MSTPQPESKILLPLDKLRDKNPDDWPEFELTNASVYLPGTTDPSAVVSLLLATEHYPVTVTGQLQPVSAELAKRYCGRSTNRTDSIVVTDVRSFAYGQYGDGEVALWAAGRAGWFTIKPGRAYRAIYNEMLEAVKLLYFVADAYRERRKVGKGRNGTVLPEYTAQEFFAHYAKEGLGLQDGMAMAEQKVCEHRDFLITSMLSGKEGIIWTKNPLFLFLKRKFPQDYRAVKMRRAGGHKEQSEVQQGVEQLVVQTRPLSTESSSGSTTGSLKRKRDRPSVNEAANGTSLDSGSVARPKVTYHRGVKHYMCPVEGCEKVYKDLSGFTYHKRHGGHPELQSTRQPSPAAVETGMKTPTTDPDETAPSIVEVSDSDTEPRQQALKGKSALRPRPSRRASKGGKGKGIATQDNDEDADEDMEAGNPRRSPTTGKHHNSRHAGAHLQLRSRSTAHPVDEGIDIPSSPASSGSPPATLGASQHDETSFPPPPAEFAHTPDQLQEDTYVCALDNCKHKVYSASHPDSQKLIREHYARHVYEDDERVRMVRLLQQPGLPVGRLMERVKGVVRGEAAGGSGVIQGIVQRY